MNAHWNVELLRELPEWLEPRVLRRDSFVYCGESSPNALIRPDSAGARNGDAHAIEVGNREKED